MKKNKILAIAAALVLVLTVGCGKEKSNEKELTSNLEKMGKQFYEKFYYPSRETDEGGAAEFFKKFEKTGIKVDLGNLSKVSVVDKELVDSMVNNKTKKECDKQKSYVVIKPKSPYGKTDYTIEVSLECGFEKAK